MEKKYLRKFEDLAKYFKPRSHEEHEFCNQVLDSIFARLGKYLSISKISDVAIWSQFTSDCLWASSCFATDQEDFRRMVMKKSVSRTHDLTQSGQRQVKTLLDRKDAYIMQILKNWNIFRWSRITLLSDLAAKLTG